MAKQALYYIFKISTSVLADSNFNINNLTVADARNRGELISVGDNQTFMFIRKLRNKTTNFDHLNTLYSERDIIKSLPHSDKNARLIGDKQKQIDDILFVDDIINVCVDNNKIYLEIGRHGFFVNNKKYKRLSCGAGQARRNTVTFVCEEIYDQINEIQMNGLNIDKINLSKYSAYYGLYTSSIQLVRTPRVCLINDCELQLFNKKVDWIADRIKVDEEGEIHEYREIEERIIDPIMNVCDGQGLISPEMAVQWSHDLELNYVPCQFIIRSSFVKGMLTTFDFHKFASEIAKTSTITDYYGYQWDINDIDVLLSVSQFKMYKYYESWQQYIDCCKRYGHVWGVARWNAKRDNTYSLLNYQYIQTLNLSHDDLLELAHPTINWINKICSGDKLYTLLFLLGVTDTLSSFEEIVTRTGNDFVKAILYNDVLLQDPHIQKKIYQSISQCVKEAKIGRLWVDGNYQIMVADPYAQAQSAFKVPVTGLLGEFEHWNKGKTGSIDACRSPLVDFSEHNILNYINTDEMRKWYSYLTSGVVYNVWGLDTIRHSDSDYDGDIVFTTNNETIKKGVCPDKNVITYEKNSAPVQRLTYGNMIKADTKSFNTKIGVITNYSTSFIGMLDKFSHNKDGNEYKELIQRIKLLRRYIGDSIDSAKGIKMKPFPHNWKSKVKVLESDTEEIKKQKYYHNNLVASKKPYFMVYIYDSLLNDYKSYKHKFNQRCRITAGCGLDELIRRVPKTNAEKNLVRQYYNYMPVLKNHCIGNELCSIIENNDFEISKVKKKEDLSRFIDILSDKSIPKNKARFDKIYALYKKYNSVLRLIMRLKNGSEYNEHLNYNTSADDQMDELYNGIRIEAENVCPNSKELANYAVEITYKIHSDKDKSFAWSICSDGLMQNIISNRSDTLEVPVMCFDDDGYEYLGKKYKLKAVRV